MRTPTKRSVVTAVAVAAALIATGCGGGGPSNNAGGGSPVGSGAATAGGSSSAAGSGAAAGSGSSASAEGIPKGALANSGKPIDIMGWTNGDEVGTSRTQYVKQQAPDLNVKIDQNGFDPQKFATAMGSGAVPAGVSMTRDVLATYAAKGFLQPLDDCISADKIDVGAYYPEALKESSWKGHVYGIPEFYSTREVLINQRVLDADGVKTTDVNTGKWAELAALTKKLYKASNGKPSTIGFDPKVPEYLPLWTMANGGSIIADDGKPTLNDPKVVAALKNAVDLINAQGGWANFKAYRDTWDFFGAGNEFAKGKDQLAVMPFEDWYLNVLAGFGDSIKMTAVPFLGVNGQHVTLSTGAAFAIPKGSPNAGGMCAFMKLATSQGAWLAAGAARQAKVQKSKGIFTGLYVANKVATESIRAKYVKPTGNAGLDRAIGVFYDGLDSAKAVPPSPAGQQITSAYQQAVTDALGGKDPKAALDAAQQEAQNAYDDANG